MLRRPDASGRAELNVGNIVLDLDFDIERQPLTHRVASAKGQYERRICLAARIARPGLTETADHASAEAQLQLGRVRLIRTKFHESLRAGEHDPAVRIERA